jgi:hypothetical protein
VAEQDKAALLVPGRGYTVQGPLLSYIDIALERRGVRVERLSWSPPDDTTPLWVATQVGQALVSLRLPHRTLVVGKSLGTLAAPLTGAVGRPLPGIWLTPLLRERFVFNALRLVSKEPALAVGGTADPISGWNPERVRAFSPRVRVHEVPRGDHSLMVPGPLAESARVLGEVLTAVERFVDEEVWPVSSGRPPRS